MDKNYGDSLEMIGDKPRDLIWVSDDVAKIYKEATSIDARDKIILDAADKIKKDIISKNIALPDKFIEHGDRLALLDKYGLSSKKIAERIKKEWQR